MLNATNSPIEVRAAEAIRYALEYKLGEWGALYATRAGQPNLIVADISITTGNVPEVGDSIWVGDTSHEVTAITYSLSLPAGYRITTADAVTAEAGVPVRLDKSLYVRRSDDTRTREGLPWLCVVQVSGLRESWPGANQFSGSLIIGIDSLLNTISSDDGAAVDETELASQRQAHHAMIATIDAILQDVQAIADLSMFNSVRCVNDFTLYGLYDTEEPGGAISGDCYTHEIRRRIVCARVDDF